ncbi:MAG TPA: DUF3553 domain-containing protein [Malonomonas sp.]
MEYFRGDRVRILGKPEWGPGFIQGKSKNGKILVEFQQAGEKNLSLRHAKLMKVVLRNPEWLEARARREWPRK